MKTKLIPALIAICALSSCDTHRNDTEYDAPRFPKEKEAKVTILNNDILTGNAFSLMLCDSVAIATAIGMDKTWFQTLALDDGRHMGGFALVGRGESELTNYNLYAIDYADKSLTAIDTNGKVVVFDLPRAVSGIKQCAKESYRFPRAVTGHRVACGNDSFLFMQGNPRFCVTDRSGKDTLAAYDAYPFVNERINGDENLLRKYFTYCAKYAASPDGTRFCAATENGMLLEIFRFDGKAIEPVGIRRLYPPKMRSATRGADDCARGTFAVEASDKYIYALYHDKPCSDKTNDPYLGVFDWKGNEVCRYTFDKRVFRIAVTPDDARAYCWGRDENGNDFLGYFDLK